MVGNPTLVPARAHRLTLFALLTDWTTSCSHCGPASQQSRVSRQTCGGLMTQSRTKTETERNKAAVLEFLTTAFSSKYFTALDRHLHPDYIQHSPTIPPARAGLRNFIADLPDATRYEPGAIIAEGDLVMIHGRYSG